MLRCIQFDLLELTISEMLRVPEATDIKLQEEPCEEERERGRAWTERGSQLGGQSRLQADCYRFQKLGQDLRLCHGNIKIGPKVIQQ